MVNGTAHAKISLACRVPVFTTRSHTRVADSCRLFAVNDAAPTAISLTCRARSLLPGVTHVLQTAADCL